MAGAGPVDQAEDSGVRTDPEAERDDHQRGVAGGGEQGPDSIPDITKHQVDLSAHRRPSRVEAHDNQVLSRMDTWGDRDERSVIDCPCRRRDDGAGHRAWVKTMPLFLRCLCVFLVGLGVTTSAGAQGRDILPPVPTPDVKPGSITCDECPYPYPSKYLDINVYSQDVRISYMDVAPRGTPNGHTAMLLHGNNFGGFYFGVIIDGLIDAGFRVIVPDQIGYGKSSKPIAPYNLSSQARNTQLILEAEQIDTVMAIGHSMGGMLATRFTTQYPDSVERLVIYNPIGLSDGRFNRPLTPVDQIYERVLQTDYQSTRRSLSRYVGARAVGVERRLRGLHPHPLLVDAQLGLAAAGHGAVTHQPDALPRPGGPRLAAHPCADAGLRRGGRPAAGTRRGVPGADEGARRDGSEREWPAASDSRGWATCPIWRTPTPSSPHSSPT